MPSEGDEPSRRAGWSIHPLPAAPQTFPLLAHPWPAGSVPTFEAAVAAVEKIRFFAGEVRSRSKMHVTVGHTTGETLPICWVVGGEPARRVGQ